jgi:hypothetical protein
LHDHTQQTEENTMSAVTITYSDGSQESWNLSGEQLDDLDYDLRVRFGQPDDINTAVSA